MWLLGISPVGTDAGPGENTLEEINSFYLSNENGSTVTVDLSTGVTQSGAGAGDYTLDPVTSCPGARHRHHHADTVELAVMRHGGLFHPQRAR